jgi:glycosyltransferase
MSLIKIDAVVVPLSGHLYPVLLLLAPLLNDSNYKIRIFTGPQKQKIALVYDASSILKKEIHRLVKKEAP